MQAATARKAGTTDCYYVNYSEPYDIVSFDYECRVLDIEEKPKRPKSHYAVTGLYFNNNDVISIAKDLRPSGREELEISDVNRAYLRHGDLRVELLGHSTAWLSTGTDDTLLDAANYMRVFEQRQGLKLGYPEEIAYRMGYISAAVLEETAAKLTKSGYEQYLLQIASET